MKTLSQYAHNNPCRGATMLVGILCAAIVFFGVIASLLSTATSHYARSVQDVRDRQALYLAEGGLARALAQIQGGEIPVTENLNYVQANGEITVHSSKINGRILIRSTALIENNQGRWSETVEAVITGSGSAAKIDDYHWMQNYDSANH